MRVLLIIVFVVFVTNAGKQDCGRVCLKRTNCQSSANCLEEINSCNGLCKQYKSVILEMECTEECLTYKKSEDAITRQFNQCLKDCNTQNLDNLVKQWTSIKWQKTESQDEIKKKIQLDPFYHTGESLEKDQNCDEKKSVFILKGNTHRQILKYFNSRCDFDVLPQHLRQSNNVYFRWQDYHHQFNFDTFQEGKQIVNHLPNMKDLLSYKDKIVQTLLKFDKKKKYTFDSSSFHFKTFIFELQNPTYNAEEQEFMEKVNSGFWLAKDPDGSLGLGIKLFPGVDEIKANIAKLKGNAKLGQSKLKEISMFSVIQQYLHNPLLINNKKMDVRGYVLVASTKPFVVLYQNGFIRKCIEKYDLNLKNFNENEAFKHLTNRIFQKKHGNYGKEKDDLMWTPPKFEQFLRETHNFDDDKIQNLWKKGMKTVAYSMEAAKEDLVLKQGFFQLLGVDIIFDDEFNAYLIEFNTSAGLYTELPPHRWVVPQMVQSTLDLILQTHKNQEKLYELWKDPSQLDLGRWQILQNEANGYNILSEDLRKLPEDL